jgi:hypothetical protein
MDLEREVRGAGRAGDVGGEFDRDVFTFAESGLDLQEDLVGGNGEEGPAAGYVGIHACDAAKGFDFGGFAADLHDAGSGLRQRGGLEVRSELRQQQTRADEFDAPESVYGAHRVVIPGEWTVGGQDGGTCRRGRNHVAVRALRDKGIAGARIQWLGQVEFHDRPFIDREGAAGNTGLFGFPAHLGADGTNEPGVGVARIVAAHDAVRLRLARRGSHGQAEYGFNAGGRQFARGTQSEHLPDERPAVRTILERGGARGKYGEQGEKTQKILDALHIVSHILDAGTGQGNPARAGVNTMAPSVGTQGIA